ncbi:hypothetical protein Fleli_0159 [Bernardetia litoralis DSM 6794]|uniref:Uncharacterized protein n=1 Tax=Bernardetia litoralis (strain ATCC 23117 / DSM 6794 / NBRC 15988 / NCIMB 1366 / Fx l1 / Sio-4) TaxID=880071 RepID=I4AFB2_BERLS|nr:hypothetical protein [Bernardetia litoralis]AFM02647.1 hypothetical protein Fleli_0148 [Bernardetia litoralis DSM 6794]AFM02658.1 hypothetical protein Fleli_0159 [Bernardetia litoralis DSM 6794]
MRNILIIITLFFSVKSSLIAQVVFLDEDQNIIQDTLFVKGKNLEYNFTIPTDSIQIYVAKCDSFLEYSAIKVVHIRGRRIFGRHILKKRRDAIDSTQLRAMKQKHISCCSCDSVDFTSKNLVSLKFTVRNIKTVGDLFIIIITSDNLKTVFRRKIWIKGEEEESEE